MELKLKLRVVNTEAPTDTILKTIPRYYNYLNTKAFADYIENVDEITLALTIDGVEVRYNKHTDITELLNEFTNKHAKIVEQQQANEKAYKEALFNVYRNFYDYINNDSTLSTSQITSRYVDVNDAVLRLKKQYNKE